MDWVEKLAEMGAAHEVSIDAEDGAIWVSLCLDVRLDVGIRLAGETLAVAVERAHRQWKELGL